MEPLAYDPQLLQSPFYARRPGSPAGLMPGGGLSVGMPMMSQQAPGSAARLHAPLSGSPGARAKKHNRVLQLPAPLRSKASYTTPLPNDCEGLIYALEGQFNCGMEIVADAANRILEAVTERAGQIAQAQDPNAGNNPFRPLLTHGAKVSHSQRLAKIKLLESSWVTSTFLADALIVNSQKYLNDLEADLETADPLQQLQNHVFEFEACLSASEALEHWLEIWMSAGALERPRISEAEALAPPPVPKLRTPPGSCLLAKPPPLQPRGVGRPKLIPVISMADFVDNTCEPLDLSAMKPACKRQIYYKAVRQLLRTLQFTIRVFDLVKDEAERIFARGSEKLALLQSAADKPAFPIAADVDMKHSVAPSPSSPTLTDSETGRSIFTSEVSWQALGADLFVNLEVKELFLETVKEAEFLIWRENRRTTSSIEMITSTAHSSERVRMENELEAIDASVSLPIVSLNNQLMCSMLTSLSLLLKAGDSKLLSGNTLAAEFVKAVIDIWRRCQGETPGPRDNQALPIVFKSIGLHLLTVILNFGRDYLTLLKPLLKTEPKLRNDILSVFCDIASHVMLSFGRFVTLKLFPSVPSSLSFAMNSIAPQCSPNLPMDVQTCKSAVVMALVCLEELNDYSAWPRLWYGLLYCAYGGAVALGRVKGFVCTRKLERAKNSSDLRTIEALLKYLPDHVRERTCQLLKQKSPQIASLVHSTGGISAAELNNRDDDVDSTLQSQDNNYLLSGTIPTVIGPIDTYDESVETQCVYIEMFQDIIYACTNAFVGMSKENREYSRFLKDHVKILEEISLLTGSQVLCRLVESLKRDNKATASSSSGLMLPSGLESDVSYVLKAEQLIS